MNVQSFVYYADTDNDGSGTLTGADALMTDADADGQPDTGDLAPGEALAIVAVYAVPANVTPAQTAVVSITASSGFEPAANDFITATLNVALPPALSVAKNMTTISDPLNGTINPKVIPGAEVEYVVTLTNQGAGTVDDNSLSLSDVIDPGSCLKVTDLAAPDSGAGSPLHLSRRRQLAIPLVRSQFLFLPCKWQTPGFVDANAARQNERFQRQAM